MRLQRRHVNRRRNPAGHRPAGPAAVLVPICLVASGMCGASAPAVAAQPPPADPRPVFAAVAQAWEGGDAQALADLVHADGLRVTSGGAGERGGHYSPAQAYYYFKNLFRAHRTLLFTFEMTQDGQQAERVHGLAVWKRRRVDSEKIQDLKVICVLAREKDRWRLSELNTIR